MNKPPIAHISFSSKVHGKTTHCHIASIKTPTKQLFFTMSACPQLVRRWLEANKTVVKTLAVRGSCMWNFIELLWWLGVEPLMKLKIAKSQSPDPSAAWRCQCSLFWTLGKLDILVRGDIFQSFAKWPYWFGTSAVLFDQKADPVDRWLHLTVIQKFCLMGIGNVVLCKGNLGISNLLEIIMMKKNLLYCDNTMMINDVIYTYHKMYTKIHACMLYTILQFVIFIGYAF